MSKRPPIIIGSQEDSLREAFGKSLVKFAPRYPDVVLLDADVALEYYNTAMALAPTDSQVAHQRGLLYLSLDKLENALGDFDTAFSTEPGNPEHLYFRATILEKLERNKEAHRTWQVAQGLYEDIGDTMKAAECSAKVKRLNND